MIMRPVVPTLATAPTKNQLLGQFLAASSERRANTEATRSALTCPRNLGRQSGHRLRPSALSLDRLDLRVGHCHCGSGCRCSGSSARHRTFDHSQWHRCLDRRICGRFCGLRTGALRCNGGSSVRWRCVRGCGHRSHLRHQRRGTRASLGGSPICPGLWSDEEPTDRPTRLNARRCGIAHRSALCASPKKS